MAAEPCDICDWRESPLKQVGLASQDVVTVRLCSLCRANFTHWFNRRRRTMKYDVRSATCMTRKEARR